MFEEGVQFADAGNWSDAIDRFRRALVLRESQVIRYNLATVLEKHGQLVESAELFRQVIRDTSVEASVRAEAHQRLDALTPSIGRLTIQTEGDRLDVLITVDNQSMNDVQLGIGIPMDPGLHKVRAVRAGRELDAREVTLAEGAEESVTLNLVSGPVVASPAQAATTEVPLTQMPHQATHATKDDRDPSGLQRSRRLWWGIGGGAAVVVATVLVSILASRGSNADSSKRYDGDFQPGSLPVEVPP